jgi:hypothetical protein
MDSDNIFDLEIDTSSQASLNVADHGFFDGMHTLDDTGTFSAHSDLRHVVVRLLHSHSFAAARIRSFSRVIALQKDIGGIICEEIRIQLPCI